MATDHADSPVARRHFLGSVAGAAATSFAQTGAMRPNIIYIHSHESGRYLQPYGHAVPAPNLQRLGTEGVLFRQALSDGPPRSSSHTRPAIGVARHRTGTRARGHPRHAL